MAKGGIQYLDLKGIELITDGDGNTVKDAYEEMNYTNGKPVCITNVKIDGEDFGSIMCACSFGSEDEWKLYFSNKVLIIANEDYVRLEGV